MKKQHSAEFNKQQTVSSLKTNNSSIHSTQPLVLDTVNLEDIDNRNQRFKALLLGNRKKVQKVVENSHVESEKFQKEVKEGLYTPTDEAVAQLNLTPHFDTLNQIIFQKRRPKAEQPVNCPKGISKDQMARIESMANDIATELYYDYHKIPLVPLQENALNAKQYDGTSGHIGTPGNSNFVLRQAVNSLQQQINTIKDQQTALKRNIMLQVRAKENLEIQIDSTIQAIQFMKEQIKQYYQDHPDVKRHIKLRINDS